MMTIKKTALVFMLAIVLLAAVFASGCSGKSPVADSQNNAAAIEELGSYIASVKEQADTLKTSLEQDELTQTDMNLKAAEMSELWNEAMNKVLDECRNCMSEEEFSKLQEAQNTWAAERDSALLEAGSGFEGGSYYSLIVGMEDARITEERVMELYELLKQA